MKMYISNKIVDMAKDNGLCYNFTVYKKVYNKEYKGSYTYIYMCGGL